MEMWSLMTILGNKPRASTTIYGITAKLEKDVKIILVNFDI